MLSIAANLIGIIGRRRQAVAAFAAVQARAPDIVWLGDRAYLPRTQPARHKPMPLETWLLLHARLGRLAGRVQSLFARWLAGTLPPPAPARTQFPAGTRTRAPSATTPPTYPRLPTTRGWINARIEAASPCAGQLITFLQQPDVLHFAATVPRAGRLLRPLCRALAVDLPPSLTLPPRPPRPRPPKPRPPKPALPPLRPLPAYVRGAVRAWKHRDFKPV